MNHDNYSNQYIREILTNSRVVAMVGASPNWNRPSFFVMKYLQAKGFRVLPINPAAEGQEILGENVYASLEQLPCKVDLVDIFRNSEAAGSITDQAIKINAKAVWMQLTIRNDAAAARAEKAGLKVVMNRCPKIEFARLNGEIGWSGVNSGVISSKRRKISL